MRKYILSLLLLPAFLVGCGTYEGTEVLPLDDGEPVPTCVTIEFSTVSEWDGDKWNKNANIYCLKE